MRLVVHYIHVERYWKYGKKSGKKHIDIPPQWNSHCCDLSKNTYNVVSKLSVAQSAHFLRRAATNVL